MNTLSPLSLESRPVPSRRRARTGICFVSLTVCLVAMSAFSSSTAAAMLSGPALVRQLLHGGFVLVMRHAQSPDAPPAATEAAPGNPAHERQLDSKGMAEARELGQAMRKLGIPIGKSYSSPTYRARETIRLAGLGVPQIVMALAEGPRGMLGSAGRAQTQWLRMATTRAPLKGTNTLIVTHTPNIVGAFGPAVADIQAGEMIVFNPAAGAGSAIVGRITVAQWRRLAMASRP